jgi:hypothetical protein
MGASHVVGRKEGETACFAARRLCDGRAITSATGLFKQATAENSSKCGERTRRLNCVRRHRRAHPTVFWPYRLPKLRKPCIELVF